MEDEDDFYPRDDKRTAIRIRYAEQTELSLLKLQERIDGLVDLMVVSTNENPGHGEPLDERIRKSRFVAGISTEILRVHYNPILELTIAISAGIGVAGGVTTLLKLWSRYAKVRAEFARSETVVQTEALKQQIIYELRMDMEKNGRDYLTDYKHAANLLENAAKSLLEIESIDTVVYQRESESEEGRRRLT